MFLCSVDKLNLDNEITLYLEFILFIMIKFVAKIF